MTTSHGFPFRRFYLENTTTHEPLPYLDQTASQAKAGGHEQRLRRLAPAEVLLLISGALAFAAAVALRELGAESGTAAEPGAAEQLRQQWPPVCRARTRGGSSCRRFCLHPAEPEPEPEPEPGTCLLCGVQVGVENIAAHFALCFDEHSPDGRASGRQIKACVVRDDASLGAGCGARGYLAMAIVTPSVSPPAQWGSVRADDIGWHSYGFQQWKWELNAYGSAGTPFQAARRGLTPAQWGLERYGVAGGSTPLQAAQRRLAFAAALQLASASRSSMVQSDDVDVVDLIGEALAALTPFRPYAMSWYQSHKKGLEEEWRWDLEVSIGISPLAPFGERKDFATPGADWLQHTAGRLPVPRGTGRRTTVVAAAVPRHGGC